MHVAVLLRPLLFFLRLLFRNRVHEISVDVKLNAGFRPEGAVGVKSGSRVERNLAALCVPVFSVIVVRAGRYHPLVTYRLEDVDLKALSNGPERAGKRYVRYLCTRLKVAVPERRLANHRRRGVLLVLAVAVGVDQQLLRPVLVHGKVAVTGVYPALQLKFALLHHYVVSHEQRGRSTFPRR